MTARYNGAVRRGVVVGALIGALGACLLKPGRPANQTGVDAAGDSSPDAAVAPNLAFVTASGYSLTGKSVGELDVICQQLGGAGRWVAWYGTPTASAIERLGNASGWVRKDGKPFASSRQDLAQGRILYPLDVDENGNTLTSDTFVATATSGSDGVGGYVASGDCFGTATYETIGAADGGKGSWTEDSTLSCSNLMHLYCFEFERASSVSVQPPQGAKLMFLTQNTYAAGSGKTGLDTACGIEAIQRGLSGAVALVATTGESAANLVIAGPYARPDGVIVFETGRKTRIAPIEVTLAGEHVQAATWAGATDLGSSATMAESCSDWTDPVANARAGDSARSLDIAFGALSASYNCGIAQHVFCMQP